MASTIGNLGEQLVIDWLRANSYRILHHSWGCRWGELDIVALDLSDRTLAFIEVKTRSSSNWDQDGLLAVSSSKQNKIIRSAELFISQNSYYADFYMRFDVALVRYTKCPEKIDQKLNSELSEQGRVTCISSLATSSSLYSLSSPNYQLHLIEYLVNAFECC